jgi:hypothetical protein
MKVIVRTTEDLEKDKLKHEIALKLIHDSTPVFQKDTTFARRARDEIVGINVGGQPFKTTFRVLQNIQDTFFDIYLSGRHNVPRTAENHSDIFVDRDPTHFQHVLNFMEFGTTPKDFHAQIRWEFEFYGLHRHRSRRQPSSDIQNYDCGTFRGPPIGARTTSKYEELLC